MVFVVLVIQLTLDFCSNARRGTRIAQSFLNLRSVLLPSKGYRDLVGKGVLQQEPILPIL